MSEGDVWMLVVDGRVHVAQRGRDVAQRCGASFLRQRCGAGTLIGTHRSRSLDDGWALGNGSGIDDQVAELGKFAQRLEFSLLGSGGANVARVAKQALFERTPNAGHRAFDGV